jgi:menaquinone-dependent protoporphyrinogen oxidase
VFASFHIRNYQGSVIDYVQRHHDVLNTKPAAFVSISLSAAGENPDDWEGLEHCVIRFLHASG